MDVDNLGKLRINRDRSLCLERLMVEIVYCHRMGLRPISLLVR